MPLLTLPTRSGVMILPDCTLFPHGGLPLQVFEPRYRDMLKESLADNCCFCIARKSKTGAISEYGTLSLVRGSRTLADGTSRVLLQGLTRVRFTNWHEGGKSYPEATFEPMISFFSPEHQSVPAMKMIRAAMEDMISPLPTEVKNGILAMIDQVDSPDLMTDIVSQQFVNDADLRQRLLEMESVSERIPLICDYLSKVKISAD